MAFRFSSSLVALFIMAASTIVSAQIVGNYPNKSIRLIIPYAVGGGADLTGRLVAAELSKAWGQGVIADNQAGGSGIVGISQGMKAAPDGHTLILMSASTLLNQFVTDNVPYDLLRDFAPLTQLSVQPSALTVNASLPARNVKELIAYAKANPGKVHFGSSGIGGGSHLMGVLFGQMAGAQLVHVPYKGGGQAIVDTIAGNIQMQFATLGLASPHLKSGKLRALAITSLQRSTAAPDIPTVSESGLPGYEVLTWHGLMLPLKTPRPIIARLNQEIARIMHSPEVAPKLVADGFQPLGSTSDQFAAALKTEAAMWSRLAKEVGLKSE